MKIEDIGPLYQDASQFDFTSLRNYIPIEKTILLEEHTITTCPALRYSLSGDGHGLVDEGCHLDRGTLEFAAVASELHADVLSAFEGIKLWLPMWKEYHDVFYRERVEEDLALLTKHQAELPRRRFVVYGTPWPGASSMAAIINNTFHVF